MTRRRGSVFARDTAPLVAPRLITEGIEVTDDAIWAWLLIPAGATYLLEDADVAARVWELAGSLGALLPAGVEYHVKVLWSTPSGTAYRDSWAGIRSVRAPGAATFLDLGAERIARNAADGFYRERVVLLGVRWPEATGSPAGERTRAVARGLRSTTAAHRDAHTRLAGVREAIDRWATQMARGPLTARPASTGVVAWALAREMRRADIAPPRDATLSGPVLAQLLHGEIDPRPARHLVVTDLTTGAARYVAILCPASVTGFPPNELVIPGGEWLEVLADVPGVEASVRGVHHGQQGSIALLDAGRRLTRSQAKEAGEHGQMPLEMAEAEEVLTLRRREVQRRQDVMASHHPRWVVDAASVEELDDRVAAVRQRYTGLVTLEVVPHVQDLLWAELLPGDRIRVREFEQLQPVRTLAGSGLAGGSAIGDDTGPYVGANLGTTPGPVRIHLVSRASAATQMPTTVSFSGRSRSGKSTSLELMSLGALAEGAWELLVDPKGDLGGIVTAARDLLGVPVQVVDVTDPAASGMMDPLRGSPTADTARSLALDALLSSLSAEDRRHEVVLETAVDTVLAMPRAAWSATTVIHELATTPTTTPGWETARAVGRTLQLRAKQPHLRAVLGPLAPDHEPLAGGRGLVYLSLAGVDLPRHNPSPDRWTIAERCAMVTFRATLAYAMHQSRASRERKKLIALAEMHLISAYPEGRATIEWLARTGAALQTYVLLDTQAAADLAAIPALVEQLVMSFVYRADTTVEQDAQAVLLGVPEPGPRLRQAQASLRTGQCIVRDRHGRRGLLEWDLLSGWLRDTLSTTAGDDTDDTDDIDDADGVDDVAGDRLIGAADSVAREHIASPVDPWQRGVDASVVGDTPGDTRGPDDHGSENGADHPTGHPDGRPSDPSTREGTPR